MLTLSVTLLTGFRSGPTVTEFAGCGDVCLIESGGIGDRKRRQDEPAWKEVEMEEVLGGTEISLRSTREGL